MTALIGPILWSVLVGITLKPPCRRGRTGFVVYVLTMAVNEIPLAFGVAILALSAISFGGWPAGTVGLIAGVLWGFVFLGLAWIQLRAGRARRALGEALDAGLVAGWLEAVRPDLRAALELRTPWLVGVLLPFHRRRAGVERVRNLTYGPHPRFHRLDAYRGPADSPRPILVHFHEGGFVQGHKSRESLTLLHQLAAHGWLCLSADYRLGAEAEHPHPLVDAKRAIAWARAHAADYGADPAQVYVAGGSAGGHLAVSAALTPDEPSLQPGFEDADTSVRAAVSLYGYLGRRTPDPASGPAGLASPAAPPLMLVVAATTPPCPPAGRTRGCGRWLRRPTNPSSSPNCPGRSTASTSSPPFGHGSRPTTSRPSSPGFVRSRLELPKPQQLPVD